MGLWRMVDKRKQLSKQKLIKLYICTVFHFHFEKASTRECATAKSGNLASGLTHHPHPTLMQALFIHGMGRTPLSALPLLSRLKSGGLVTSTFGYATAFHDFSAISQRLAGRIAELARQGDYVLIGHSLGGVLLRSALTLLPADTPQPSHVFLLGSPVLPSRLAQKMRRNIVFRAVTQDCGQLLGSDDRMAGIATVARTTSIIGTKGITGKLSPFGDEPNDGVVSVSETRAAWITDEVQVPIVHTLLPASPTVADIILQKLREDAEQVAAGVV